MPQHLLDAGWRQGLPVALRVKPGFEFGERGRVGDGLDEIAKRNHLGELFGTHSLVQTLLIIWDLDLPLLGVLLFVLREEVGRVIFFIISEYNFPSPSPSSFNIQR